MIPLRTRLAPTLVWLCALLLGMEVGGGVYEHLVLDRAWPTNPALVQPSIGGVNRATFWMVIHSALLLSLVAALWASWRQHALRRRVAWALGIHLVLRAWSFAYFIPAVLRFEQAGGHDPADIRTWVLLSPLRTLLTLAAFVLLFRPKDVGEASAIAQAPHPEN